MKSRGRILYSDEMKKGILSLIQDSLKKEIPWYNILKKVRQSYPNYVGGLDALKQLHTRCLKQYGTTSSNVTTQPASTSVNELNQVLQKFINEQAENKTKDAINAFMDNLKKDIIKVFEQNKESVGS